MSSELEASVRECGAGLTSVRATDRKKYGEALKSFLSANAVPALLSENTIQNRGYTWNDVFDDIQELVIKETEKYESSKSYSTVMGPLCENLLHLCVAGSNKGKAFIRSDKIVQACLFILRDSRLTKAIGNAYLKLLYKHVLTSDNYLNNITPTSWEDILDVCLSVFLAGHSKLDAFTKLRLLLLVIRNGSSHCQFVIPLRDALTKLKTYFSEFEEDKKVQELVIEITILLLETLSAECRLTICEFIEGLLKSFIQFYEPNLDTKKKTSLFKVFQLSVVLHHPLGRGRYESGSLAYNWALWNKHLHHILEIVCSEVNFMQKQRKQSDLLLKHCNVYYELAASVYFQIFKLSSQHDQEEAGNVSKRPRISMDKNNSFSDLIDGMTQNHVPWLGIINKYVKSFDQSISTEDYMSLLTAAELLISNNSNLDWNQLETMICFIIKALHTRAKKTDKEDVYISLWNSCVRSSSLTNSSHRALHSVMQCLIKLDILTYQQVRPLIILYYDRGMPATDHSLKTLNMLYHKFFSKCSNFDERSKCMAWLIQSQLPSLDIANVKELLLRLLVTENVHLHSCNDSDLKSQHNIIFNSIETCILFSEFELDVPEKTISKNKAIDNFELHTEINKEIKQFLEAKLSEYSNKLHTSEINLLDYVKLLNIALNYLDIMLKNKFMNRDEFQSNKIQHLLKIGIQDMYASLNNNLKSDKSRILDQIELVRYIQNILVNDFDHNLSNEVRRIPADFFKTINVIVNKKQTIEEGILYDEEDSAADPQLLRHACMNLLAAYCKETAAGRSEILDFILDPKVYNFTNSWDVDCALDCIELLSASTVKDVPLESIFVLMQGLCKDLFKSSQATFKLLKVFVKFLDRFWELENGKQNCCIMVRGYLQRSEKKFYPPEVAALIYECAARLAALKLKQLDDTDHIFLEAVLKKISGETHSMRLYSCYLLKLVISYMYDRDISSFLTDLSDLFSVEISENRESVLKDEFKNRNVTLLHSLLAVVQAKHCLLHSIITQTIQMKKDKKLDKELVKKVLDIITKIVAKSSVETYLNDNVLFILNFWFFQGNAIDELPIYLFGFEKIESFLEKHLRWVIPSDIIWRKKGIVKESDVLKLVEAKCGKSADTIIEACICNIISLCLPYVVVDKFELDYIAPGKREWLEHAKKMFETTRQLLGAERWSTLFVQHLSKLTVLIASHLRDYAAAKQKFNVNVPSQSESFYYPKAVLDAIFADMGELIDENILVYLCENQSLAIFKALNQLWANVVQEHVFEFKVVCLHSFLTFLETIPLGYPSDAFICTFACNSLAHAVKESQNKDDIVIFVKGLHSALQIYLPEKVDIVRKLVSNILSILMVKKAEGFDDACEPLLIYLTCDMKDCLKESEDVIDFIASLSQRSTDNLVHCSSKTEFMEKMKTYQSNLSCTSIETLINLRQFLKLNKCFVNTLRDELNTKGFSDDCGSSLIHQIIHSLSNTLKSATDEKTIIEACNCLTEIGNYDLKTLVTVQPANTQRISNIDPKQYFGIAAMTALTEMFFNKDPNATNCILNALQDLTQHREGKIALDLDEANQQMLKPLLVSEKSLQAEFKLDLGKFKLLCLLDYWIPKSKENQIQWLKRITCDLLDVLASSTNYLNTLHTVCLLMPEICKSILPPLMGLLLECSPENVLKALGQQLNRFFQHVWELTFDNKSENTDSEGRRAVSSVDHDLKIIVQYMLDIVNFIRLQRPHYKTRSERATKNMNYLRLDYDKVAWIATLADQNMAAIYYGELWATAQNMDVPPASPEATTQLNGGENIQRIFRKCFVSIGEMDAIDGCGTAHLTSEEEKRKHLISTGQFGDALLVHDIALSCSGYADPTLQYGVVKSLHKSGMHHLALQYIKSLPENDELNDIKYECLSFLGDWSDLVTTSELEDKSNQTNCNPYSIIKAFRYSCLKDCLNLQLTTDFNENKLIMPLNRAKRAVSKLCQTLNMENCQNVYKIVSKLHLFGDIEDYFLVRCDKMSIGVLLRQWQVDKLPAYNDFKYLEALITQRSLILEHAAKTYQTSLKDITSLQLQYTELSLSNDRIQMAQRLLAVVKKNQSTPEVALADSQISWAKGQKDIALSLLRGIVLNPSDDVKLNAISFRQYGIWMAESKRDNARDIINKYLKKSLEVLRGSDHERTRLKVYYDIAKFADAEYKQVVAYMNSSVFEKKLQCIENMKGTANTLRSTQQAQQLSKDERKALTASDRFGKIDEEEVASTKSEKETFLHLAMRYYLLSLKQCEVNNLSVFRVISLWLDNQGIQLADADGGNFEELLHSIPSRKFIAVLPQLAPRLTNDKNVFADNLRMIINRCAMDHPHHTLPILFSLKNSDKDRMILNASENIGKSSQRAPPKEPRVAAAETMINQLAQHGSTLAAIIHQMDKLCDATISLANYVPKTKEMRQNIPAAERLHKLGHLDAIPIPTVTISIREDCNYSHLPTLYAFDDCFELVGGINCPKKITCKSSDGLSRILLIKGEDDMRQDAVMQQVFNIVNTLLENDPVTSRNKLLIRTYKVVPLSRRSGVLEWCEGTMPIGHYLTGNTGAHARHRPQDISAAAARAHMTALHEKRRPNQERLTVFLKILKQFRPVFHYFFTEHYLDPVTWYERRLAYTKSVASSSMVGYILGLGDRHLQNILIDKKTAEVVHIDFGIAFDQGKTLPTPETIPFRLTQDIIAGFGSSGVEGTFRRSCEKTMQLLRDNQETLLTILEVLLCDPLFSWTITSKQQNILAAQSGDITLNPSAGSGESLAKRALLSVSSKLNGTEGGVAGGMAVPGQVARLIHSAMDPVNLCRLFHGWQPYL